MKRYKVNNPEGYNQWITSLDCNKKIQDGIEVIELDEGEQVINICNIMKRLNDDKKLSDNGKRIIVSFLKVGGADIIELPKPKE